MSTLRVYAVGGAGANICKQASAVKSSPHCADLNVVYTDCSDANFRVGFEKESIHIIPNVAGSGKVRRENSTVIQRGMVSLLESHPPGDFNIIVGSGSGGSGSVIGPVLLAELLSRNIPAVILLLGTVESAQATSNTMDTLKTLAGIASKRKLPVSMFYRLQDPTDSEQETNDMFITCLSKLALVVSQRNDDLDRRDMHNFVFYPNITKSDPALLVLDVANPDESFKDDLNVENVITLVDVLPSRDTSVSDIVPLYRTVGYADIPQTVTVFTTPDLLDDIVNEVDVHGKRSETLRNSIKSNPLLESDDSDDDGFVFT